MSFIDRLPSTTNLHWLRRDPGDHFELEKELVDLPICLGADGEPMLADPQDRALGLELELIELVRRRDEAAAQGYADPHLDEEVARTQLELARVSEQAAAMVPV